MISFVDWTSLALHSSSNLRVRVYLSAILNYVHLKFWKIFGFFFVCWKIYIRTAIIDISIFITFTLFFLLQKIVSIQEFLHFRRRSYYNIFQTVIARDIKLVCTVQLGFNLVRKQQQTLNQDPYIPEIWRLLQTIFPKEIVSRSCDFLCVYLIYLFMIKFFFFLLQWFFI